MSSFQTKDMGIGQTHRVPFLGRGGGKLPPPPLQQRSPCTHFPTILYALPHPKRGGWGGVRESIGKEAFGGRGGLWRGGRGWTKISFWQIPVIFILLARPTQERFYPRESSPSHNEILLYFDFYNRDLFGVEAQVVFENMHRLSFVSVIWAMQGKIYVTIPRNYYHILAPTKCRFEFLLLIPLYSVI